MEYNIPPTKTMTLKAINDKGTKSMILDFSFCGSTQSVAISVPSKNRLLRDHPGARGPSTFAIN